MKKTNEELEAENVRLTATVSRLTYLAVDHGLGVWRCEKCDARYTTLPNASAVCGEIITTYSPQGANSVPCLGRLVAFVPEPIAPRDSGPVCDCEAPLWGGGHIASCAAYPRGDRK